MFKLFQRIAAEYDKLTPTAQDIVRVSSISLAIVIGITALILLIVSAAPCS